MSRPLSERLEALNDAVVAAKARAREMEDAQRAVHEKVAEATEAIVEAHAVGDDATAAKVSKQRARLEQGAVREAEEKLAGAKRAVARAEAEVTTFATENLMGLLRERQPDAEAVARATEKAIAQLGRAHAEWHGVANGVAALLRTAGEKSGAMPSFPAQLEDLVRDARRAGGVGVPEPLPARVAVAATITPEHDPDPEVREAARARLGTAGD